MFTIKIETHDEKTYCDGTIERVHVSLWAQEKCVCTGCGFIHMGDAQTFVDGLMMAFDVSGQTYALRHFNTSTLAPV